MSGHVLAEAAGIAPQPRPLAAHLIHSYATLTAVFHLPVVVEKVFPIAAMPETTGAPVATGTGATMAVAADAANADAPFTFVARTVERTVLLPSAPVSA